MTLEAICRKLCQLRSIDPNSTVWDGLSLIPNWKLFRHEVRDYLNMQEAVRLVKEQELKELEDQLAKHPRCNAEITIKDTDPQVAIKD